MDTKRAIYSTQHFDMEAMAKAMMNQWDEVPPALTYHISTAEDIKQESIRFESIGIAASYEAVSTMVATDYALGLARSCYEVFQGQVDFKGKKSDPNWQPPREYIYRMNGTVETYDGTQSTEGARAISKTNSHKMDRGKMLNFDSDGTKRLSDDNEKRMGGFGQGTKIELALSVANKQDRINILNLILSRGGLKDWEIEKFEKTIERLQFSLKNEGENETFSTVQSQGHDGRYYRIYCYREPYVTNDVELWKLKYIVCDLDEAKIPVNELGQTIVSVHNPDPEFCRVLDAARENILLIDPEYSSPSSLVRVENDARSTVKIEITHHESKEKDKKSIFDDKIYLPGSFDVERLRRQNKDGGRIYFRKLRLLPEEDPQMNLVFDYNLDNMDAEAAKVFKRTSNSTYVTGPISEVISQTIGRMTNVEDWAVLFKTLEQLTTTGGEIDTDSWPELCPTPPKFNSKNVVVNDIKSPVYTAFMSVWPNSGGKFCENEAQSRIYSVLRNEKVPMPVIPWGGMEKFLYFEGNVKSVRREIDDEMSRRFNLKQESIRVDITSKESLENARENPNYKLIMDDGPLTMEKFIQIAFVDNDIFDIRTKGKTYYVDAPYGKHVIDIVFSDPHLLSNIFWEINHGYIDANDQKQLFLLMAINSGLDLNILQSSIYSEERSTSYFRTDQGENIRVEGETQRDEKHGDNCRLRFGGSFDQISNILSIMDQSVGKDRPNLIAARPGNEFQETADTIQSVIDTLKPGEKVTGETLNSVKKMLTDAATKQEEAQNALAEFKGEVKRRIGGQTGGGDINGAQMTGEFREGGNYSSINREGVAMGRSSRANSYRSRPRMNNEKSGGTQNKEKELVFKRPDYKIMMYDGRQIDDFHPLEAYETLSYHNGEILQENRFNDVVSAEAGNGLWRSYNSSQGPGYIERQNTKQNEFNYDGIIEASLTILPISGETVLPVDALKYDIVYIQLPINSDETPDPPFLMKDLINDQFQIIFSQPGQKSDMIKVLPRGTRIYIKEKSKTDQTDEQRLAVKHPEYFNRLSETLIVEEKLKQDREAEKVLRNIRDRVPPLTRREKVQAVNDFWYKRRLYDNEGIKANSIEELIQSGVGVCAESEIGMNQMLRFVGVKCRTRAGYPDSRQSGQMTPPLHAEIEFLNDDGMWEKWDPPNSRATDAYSKKMAKNAAVGKVPTIFDAGSLGRGQNTKTIKLPKDIVEIMEKVHIRKGADIGSDTADILTRVLHGEKVDPEPIISELTKEFAQSKEAKFKLAKAEKEYNPKSIKSILFYLAKSRLKLKALRGLYGLHSDEVAEFENQLALNLAKKFIEGMEK